MLESDPPHRLVVSWADPDEAADPAAVSRVAYTLEAMSGCVKLTVSHEELQPDSGMLRGISFGWPVVLSNLKTFMESGAALPDAQQFGKRPTAAAGTT